MSPKTFLLTIMFVFAFCLGLATANADQVPDTAANKPAATAQPQAVSLTFKPPKRGMPKARRIGGSRGEQQPLPELTVLAPERVGLSAISQPVLQWRQDGEAEATFLLTITDESTQRTVVELRIDKRHPAGIHRLDLAALDVQLKPGVIYSWAVGLTSGVEHASTDPYSAGGITYEPPSAALVEALTRADLSARAGVLAEHGYWYDAMAQLSTQVGPTSAGLTARRLRASLLEQVGLESVAAAELDRMKSQATARPTDEDEGLRFTPTAAGVPRIRRAAAARGAGAADEP